MSDAAVQMDGAFGEIRGPIVFVTIEEDGNDTDISDTDLAIVLRMCRGAA